MGDSNHGKKSSDHKGGAQPLASFRELNRGTATSLANKSPKTRTGFMATASRKPLPGGEGNKAHDAKQGKPPAFFNEVNRATAAQQLANKTPKIRTGFDASTSKKPSS